MSWAVPWLMVKTRCSHVYAAANDDTEPLAKPETRPYWYCTALGTDYTAADATRQEKVMRW